MLNTQKSPKAHRCPRDVLEMSYRGPETSRPLRHYTKGILRVYKKQVYIEKVKKDLHNSK